MKNAIFFETSDEAKAAFKQRTGKNYNTACSDNSKGVMIYFQSQAHVKSGKQKQFPKPYFVGTYSEYMKL